MRPETRFTTSGATEAELAMRAECREAFDTFMAMSPNETELVAVRDLCLDLILSHEHDHDIPQDAEAAA